MHPKEDASRTAAPTRAPTNQGASTPVEPIEWRDMLGRLWYMDHSFYSCLGGQYRGVDDTQCGNGLAMKPLVFFCFTTLLGETGSNVLVLTNVCCWGCYLGSRGCYVKWD
jgi:hypothetical protein